MDKRELEIFRDEMRQFSRDFAEFKKLFMGNGAMGFSQKVNIMWRIHVWVLCALSSGLGVILTVAVQRWMKQ